MSIHREIPLFSKTGHFLFRYTITPAATATTTTTAAMNNWAIIIPPYYNNVIQTLNNVSHTGKDKTEKRKYHFPDQKETYDYTSNTAQSK